jgi:hypothetical protein
MARMRHLIWRTVPKCPSDSCPVIINDKALRVRVMNLVKVVKFVPNAAGATRDAAITWLLSHPHYYAQLPGLANGELCGQPVTAADFDR